MVVNSKCKIINNSIRESFMVTQKWMDEYIHDIKYRVLQGKLPKEDMRIVNKYRECERLGKIDFKKLMKQLTE